MLYKYRSPQQLHFTLDILMRRRLYAAQYTDLNDPMEGLWHYGGSDTLWPDEIRFIDEEVAKYRVTSLSGNSTSMLMWTHYADSHRGMVIGLEVPKQPGAILVPVTYSGDHVISKDATDVGLDILSRKSLVWNYEREYRMLTSSTYVQVEPREIIFGLRAESMLVDLLTEISAKFCPVAKVYKMKLADLDAYVDPE